MNKQDRGNGNRGIEYCDYTLNIGGGCMHRCRWKMPDGSVARCYAEDVALGVARKSYPYGFEHHYWHPERLGEPFRLKEPSKIFVDSMADLMGTWVSASEVESLLDMCRRAPWHTFQLLTKNAPRLLQFDFPSNVWLGASVPPDFMFRKALTRRQQERMLRRALDTLERLSYGRVTWMSFEPLSRDVSDIVADYPHALRWAVVGAASNGKVKYQPDPAHVENLLRVLDEQGVPTFFKGNLEWEPRREEWPRFCGEEGCGSPDVIECILGYMDEGEYVTEVEHFCAEHCQKNGYCWGCGHFWAGCESFDFDPTGLCSNCRHDPDLVGYPEDLDGWEWLDAWADYPAELLAGEVSGE